MLQSSGMRVRNRFTLASRRSSFPVLSLVIALACGCAQHDEPRVAEKPGSASQPITIKDPDPVESEPNLPQAVDEAGSRNPGGQTAKNGPTEPSAGPTSAAEPSASSTEAPRPRRPTDDWVIFREAYHPREDATCETHWIGRNQFEVRTENVQRVTIDLSKVPEGAPKKGPWIIRMDGQAIELTGFNPKPGYTGLKRDLIRSKNGQWSVDRSRLYRSGT